MTSTQQSLTAQLPSPTEGFNGSCVQIGDSPATDLLMSVYIIAFIVGLLFNVWTLHPVFLQVRQQNVLGIFLLSLSISDLLFIITLPLWINYYYQNHQWQLGIASCSIAGFFYYSNMYISIYLLCCISVDRSLVVCYPLKFKTRRNFRYAWIQCAVVYTVVVTLHIFVLFYDNLKDAHDDMNKNDRCYENYPMPENVAIFNMIRVGFGFLLPLVVLVVCYWRILAKVDQSPGLSVQAKRKIRLLSYGVIGIFSFCFAPYHILLFVRSIMFFRTKEDDRHPGGSYCKFEESVHFPFSCTLVLSSLNCVMDPVLYVLVSNAAQNKMKWWKKWRKNTPSDHCALQALNRERSSNLL